MSAARAEGAPPPSAPDPALLREFWDALVLPGDVHEARIPKTRKGPARLWGVASGYFDDPDAFVAAVAPLTGADAEGVYLTLNPVDPALLARAANRLACGKPPTTADRDVVRLRHLLVDADPVRPSGISATGAERDAALAVRDAARLYLRDEAGWPHPVAVTESGNGGGLIYRVDLPNDPEHVALVKAVLVGLGALFGTAEVSIDATTANPARVTKAVGTVAAKGDDTADRRHRLATGRINPNPRPVPVDRLRTVTDLAPAPAPAARPSPGDDGAPRRGLDVRDLLRGNGVVYAEKGLGYATALVLDRCLTSADHADGAVVLEFPSGALAYRCQHDSCAGKGWAEARGTLGLPVRASATESLAGVHRHVHLGATRGINAPPSAKAPEPVRPALTAEARYGLAGDVVAAIEPHTEGDPVAVLVNFLVMAGNAIGSGPYVAVGGARHGAADFAAQVGETAKARKGTAHADTLRVVREADATWAGTRVTGGLSSGEGLVYPIRDPVEATKKGETVVTDPGEPDKRLLVVEEEFSAVLKVATREGNTLTEQLRKAWDGRQLGVMTRNSPLRATGGHVGILAHVTKDELLRVFDSTDAANGFGNRFAWFVVGRSKLLPEGGRVPDAEVAALVVRTRAALDFARKQGEVRRDDDARALWADVYPTLSAARPGLLGALTARAEAHVLRWSLLYALLDRTPAIGVAHLVAALALWDYAGASARFVFGDATGDPIADRVLAALRANGPMAQTEVVDLFGRNVNGARLGRAQEALVRAGLVRGEQEATGGRPRTVWRAA